MFGLGKKGSEAPPTQNNENKPPERENIFSKIGSFVHKKEAAHDVAPIAPAVPEVSTGALAELSPEAPVDTPEIAADDSALELGTSVDASSETSEVTTLEVVADETVLASPETAPDTDLETVVTSETETVAEISEPAGPTPEDVPENVADDTEKALQDFASTLDAVADTTEEAEAPSDDIPSLTLEEVPAPESFEAPAPQEELEEIPASDDSTRLEIPARPSISLVAPERGEQPSIDAPERPTEVAAEPRGKVVAPERESEDQSADQLAA